MNIVFFTHYFPPEGNAPASRTYEHCVRWAAKGHKITVITCNPNVPDGVLYDGYKNRLIPQRSRMDGIEVIRVWTYLAANAGSAKRIANFLSYLFMAVLAFVFLCRRPHVVIATSPQFFCGWAGTIASWLKWTPFILEIRDIWPESIVAVDAMKPGLLIRILEVMEKWMYRSATQIVAVGEGYKQAILKRVPTLTNISVITNGVDLEKFSEQASDDAFLQKWGMNGKFICSYVGTIGLAHGLDVVVRAARILKESNREDIVFCLVGAGASLSDLKQQVRDHGLESFVVLTDRLPKEEMPSVLASSDVLLIHLKRCDLFQTVIPSKMFEAMAMGKPIIMGVEGESMDIVTASRSGIPMRPDNEQDLVDAVVRLSTDKKLLTEMSAVGRPFVAAHYTRDVLADRFLKLIEATARASA